MPKFADFAGNKEYECKKCHKNTKFAKFYDDKEGKLLTVDGKEPNGKFGKETNVFSARVNLDKTIHPCYEVKWPNPQSDFMEKESIQNAQTNPNVQLAPSPLVKEMVVTDLAEPAMRREVLVHCKVLGVIESVVQEYLGKDANPARIGLYINNVRKMLEK